MEEPELLPEELPLPELELFRLELLLEPELFRLALLLELESFRLELFLLWDWVVLFLEEEFLLLLPVQDARDRAMTPARQTAKPRVRYSFRSNIKKHSFLILDFSKGLSAFVEAIIPRKAEWFLKPFLNKSEIFGPLQTKKRSVLREPSALDIFLHLRGCGRGSSDDCSMKLSLRPQTIPRNRPTRIITNSLGLSMGKLFLFI